LFNARHAQKAAGLLGHGLKADEVAALTNDIKEVAMLSRSGVDLMFNCT